MYILFIDAFQGFYRQELPANSTVQVAWYIRKHYPCKVDI